MPFSDIFHPECDPVEPDDALNHAVFSCLQWKTPSLEVMPRAAKQFFALMYGGPTNPINPYVAAALVRAYVIGALSAVKLIAVVSSTTFLEIESLWIQVMCMCMSHTRLTVDFANVSEVYPGRSDYIFWRDAKEILESYSLGIEQYDLASLDDSLTYHPSTSMCGRTYRKEAMLSLRLSSTARSKSKIWQTRWGTPNVSCHRITSNRIIGSLTLSILT